MISNRKVHVDPIDTRRRLDELGLKEEHLLTAVRRGHAARLSCTANHPSQSPGYYAWSETVCVFREQVIPLDWERSDEGNLPFTVNPGRSVAIAVATGDEDTGRPDREPCTKSSKGPRTKSAVDENEHQMLLFGDIRLRPEHLKKINARMTWLLLIHCDMQSREVRAELSRPVSMNEEGHVDGWDERIVLTPFPFDSDLVDVAPLDNAPQSPEIVVEIKRRV